MSRCFAVCFFGVLSLTTVFGQLGEPPEIHETFFLGDYLLDSGITLINATIAFKTYGFLTPEKDNVILFPTFFSGDHTNNEWLIGPEMGLDPRKYFIIVPNLFGNGLSSSPSNSPPPFDRGNFPEITYQDNVRGQQRLLWEAFGITKLKLVVGWSMGAMQTYLWASMFPDMVERALPFCGSPRTADHNYAFLDAVKYALEADETWNNGFYDTEPIKGQKGFARVYASYGTSQTWYRRQLWKTIGYSSREDFVIRFWDARMLAKDANNLLSHVDTWQTGDISVPSEGAGPVYTLKLVEALRNITARMIIMPSVTDMYFRVQENIFAAIFVKHAEYRPIPSVWGHQAGGGINPRDIMFIDQAVRDILMRPPGQDGGDFEDQSELEKWKTQNDFDVDELSFDEMIDILNS